VQLNSGGPRMTVNYVNVDSSIDVRWFDNAGTLHQGKLAAGTFVVALPSPSLASRRTPKWV
jgi:hypothetical protein